MTSFFPDRNVWLALSVESHRHSPDAWRWIDLLPKEAKLIFRRYTPIGLIRLLTTRSQMGEETLMLKKAWAVYDRWLEDPRLEFYPEAGGLEAVFPETRCPSLVRRRPKASEIAICLHTQSTAKERWSPLTGRRMRMPPGRVMPR